MPPRAGAVDREDKIGEQGLLEPGVHFLPKPFRKADLVRAVADAANAKAGPEAGQEPQAGRVGAPAAR